MDSTVRYWSPKADEAIIFLSYVMSESLSDIIQNRSDYRLLEERSELDRSCFERGRFPPLVATFPILFGKRLNIVWTRRTGIQHTEIDDQFNAFKSWDPHSVLTTSYKNWSLLLFAALSTKI